jgi:lysophospholipase L1-like esterase
LHIRALNHDLAAWCTEVEVPLVAGLFDMFESRPALLDDGVHPTNEGNAVIAAAVAAKIIEIQTVPRAYQRQQILTTPSMPQPGIPIQ